MVVLSWKNLKKKEREEKHHILTGLGVRLGRFQGGPEELLARELLGLSVTVRTQDMHPSSLDSDWGCGNLTEFRKDGKKVQTES